MQRKEFFLTGLSLLLLIGFLAFGTTQIELFKAALFGGGAEISTQISKQIYIPNDYRAQPGERGEVLLKSTESFDQVLGFEFELSWNTSHLSFLDLSQQDTVFAGQGFLVQEHLDTTAGTLHVVAVKSGTGIQIPAGANLFRLSFATGESVSQGTQTQFDMQRAEIVREIGGEIVSTELTTRNGALTFTDQIPTIQNMTIVPGEQTTLPLAISSVSSAELSGVVGISFVMEWNATLAELDTVSLENTALADNFLLEYFEENPGVVHVSVVSAGDGVPLQPTQAVANALLSFSENLVSGNTVDILFRDITTTLHNLTQQSFPNQTTTFTVSNAGTLELINTETLSPNRLALHFSDYIAKAQVRDITLSPNIIDNATTVRIQGKTVFVENLKEQVPNLLYTIHITGVQGNSRGAINPDFSTGFVQGFVAENVVSSFQVHSAMAESATEIVLQFSKSINPASVEANDITLSQGEVITITPNGSRLILQTTDLSAVTEDILITIANQNPQNDLKDTQGKLLSQNIAVVAPFEALTQESLQLMSAAFQNETTSHELVLSFSAPIKGSSLSPTDITINGNTLPERTALSFSPDNRKVFLSPVASTTDELYVVQVAANSAVSAQNIALTGVGRTAITFGKNTVFEQNDFQIENIATLSPTSFAVTFSDTINQNLSLTPLDLQVLFTQENTQKSLTVTDLNISGTTITATTAQQVSGKQYVALFPRESWKNTAGQMLNNKSSLSFRGFASQAVQITAITPSTLENNQDHEVTIVGNNFPSGSLVKINGKNVAITSQNTQEIIVNIPAEFSAGDHRIQLFTPDGQIITSNQNLLIHAPAKVFTVLSEQSFASPKLVERGDTTTLWVRIFDPRGVSDIEKVTADLRPINGTPAARFAAGEITELQQWFSLEITIPETFQINESAAVQIPVIAENKSGQNAQGSVSFSVVRESVVSNPPAIESITLNRPSYAPNSEIPLQITAVVTDDDGAQDIVQVVAHIPFLGPQILLPLEGGTAHVAPENSCTNNDYIIEDWGTCNNGEQSRQVRLKDGVECREQESNRPNEARACTAARACTTDDYEVGSWSTCASGSRTRSVQKKSSADCTEDPNVIPDTQESCTTSRSLWEDLFFPTAFAANEMAGVRQWFESEKISLPNDIRPGTYEISVTAIDSAGKETVSAIPLKIDWNTGAVPYIDKDDITIAPSRELLRDGVTAHTFSVRVRDENGGNDVTSVIADLSPLRMPPTPMTRQAVQGNTAYYILENIILPQEASLGFNKIEFIAADSQGNTYDRDVTIEVVKITDKGHDPEIVSDRGYMTPKAVINDGRTKFTAFIFAKDRDGFEDISHVTLELNNVATFVGSTSNPFNPLENISGENTTADDESSANQTVSFLNPFQTASAAVEIPKNTNCVTTSTIVCAFPSVTEGDEGRWFYVPDLVIPPSTQPSREPYLLRVVVSDVAGRTAEGIMQVFVSDGNFPDEEAPAPRVTQVVAINNREVEVAFEPYVDPKRVQSGAFQVLQHSDSQNFGIRKITVSADGSFVTLQTNFMVPDDLYTLIVNPEKLGLRSDQFGDTRLNFQGYSPEKAKKSGGALALVAKAEGTKLVRVKFNTPIKISALSQFEPNNYFRIYERGNLLNGLSITNIRIGNDATELLLSTEQQQAELEYTLEARDVEDIYGVKNKRKSFRNFVGYTPSTQYIAAHYLQKMDSDRDGQIGFGDFTVFSSAYGSNSGDTRYRDVADYDENGTVDFNDFSILSGNYGSKLPPPPNPSTGEDTNPIYTSDNTDTMVTADDLEEFYQENAQY